MFAYSRNPDLMTVVDILRSTTTDCTLKSCVFQKTIDNKHKSIDTIHGILQNKECNDSCCNVT